MNEEPLSAFTDVCFSKEPEPTVSYRTGNMVFEEGMRGGRLVALSYNASGYLMGANPRPRIPFMDTRLFACPESFRLEADGQTLGSHWEWLGLEQTRTDRGLSVRIRLRHTLRNVTVAVCTLLDGTPVMTRWLEVGNTGGTGAAIGALAPLSGGLQVVRGFRDHLKDGDALYRVGYMAESGGALEGAFRWFDLPSALYTVCGRYRRDRHRHPMFVLSNRATGEHFVCQFGWSGGYAFEFDLNQDLRGDAAMALRIAMDSPAPLLVLAPGERYESPKVHFGAVFGGLDEAVNAMHSHVRKSVLYPQARGYGAWVETGIGPEYNMDRGSTLGAVDYAAQIGSELFYIDAGWYTPPGHEDDWWKLAGDWTFDRERYPNGIDEIREYVHKKGMLFGMWMDAERIGSDSRVFREHGDWIAKTYRNEKNGAGLLNLADPAPAAWMEAQIARLIEEYRVDMFRLDWNVGASEALNCAVRDGYLENTYARYYGAVYAMYRRLRAKYPNVVFENCASGGARTDLGMVAPFAHTWVSDWQLAPRSFGITNGMTMALPPESVDRLIGGMNAYKTADLRFQLRNLLFARPTIGLIHPQDVPAHPGQIECIRHCVELYKNFIRPMHPESYIYHHTPELSRVEPRGFGILELASKDRTRDVIGVFQLSDPERAQTVVYPRGLDISKNYRVTFDNDGQSCVLTGYALQNDGVRIRLEGALTSELLCLEAV